MKIMQVAYKAEITGGEMVMLKLIKALVNMGHEITAVVPGPGNLLEELIRMNIPVDIVNIRKTYDIPSILKLASIIRYRRPHILHTHSMMTNIIGRISGFIANVPASFSTCHLTHQFYIGGRSEKKSDKLKAIYYSLVDNMTALLNSCIFAVSKDVRNDLILQGISPRRVKTVLNGIDIENIRKIPQNSNISQEFKAYEGISIIGTIARLSPQKDIFTFLDTIKIIVDSGKSIWGIIVGDGPEKEALQIYANKIGVKEYVFFTGYRENAFEIAKIFDIFCLTSLWEGLPIVILEAMALEKPIVATNVPGTIEALADTGIIVPMKKPEIIAERIMELLDDKEKAKILGIRAGMRAQRHFSFERMAKETERHYIRALSKAL